MIVKFKVLNQFLVLGANKKYNEGDIIFWDSDEIYQCYSANDVYRWQRQGLIEEIIEADKKPNSLEENTNIEEDIYSRKYNIYEILTLIPNIPKDSKFKCSLDGDKSEFWYASKNEKTLVDEHKGTVAIEEYYELKDILEATYTIVKPVEEVKDNWVKIHRQSDLCTAIVNKKMIKLGDGEPFNEYNDKQIETLFGALGHGIFKIEYLEEN